MCRARPKGEAAAAATGAAARAAVASAAPWPAAGVGMAGWGLRARDGASQGRGKEGACQAVGRCWRGAEWGWGCGSGYPQALRGSWVSPGEPWRELLSAGVSLALLVSRVAWRDPRGSSWVCPLGEASWRAVGDMTRLLRAFNCRPVMRHTPQETGGGRCLLGRMRRRLKSMRRRHARDASVAITCARAAPQPGPPAPQLLVDCHGGRDALEALQGPRKQGNGGSGSASATVSE